MTDGSEKRRESARDRAERVWKGWREAIADSGPVVLQKHASPLPAVRVARPRGPQLTRPSGPAEAVAMGVALLGALGLAVALAWGVVWLVVTLISGLLSLLAAIGVGLFHGALHLAHSVSTSPAWHALLRLAGFLAAPVHVWLERHAGQLPFAPDALFTAWWIIGALLWWRAERNRNFGPAIAFGLWAATSTAVIWAGSAPEARTATLAVAGIVGAVLSLRLLPRGLFTAHVTVQEPARVAAKPEPEVDLPAPRPAWLAEAVRTLAQAPDGMAAEDVAARLGRSRDVAVVRAALRGAAERGHLAHREVFVHPDHT